MNTTDEKLKAALARMLPERLVWNGQYLVEFHEHQRCPRAVLDTELLALVREVELGLDEGRRRAYIAELGGRDTSWDAAFSLLTASWQRRVSELCRVKGIEL